MKAENVFICDECGCNSWRWVPILRVWECTVCGTCQGGPKFEERVMWFENRHTAIAVLVAVTVLYLMFQIVRMVMA